MTSPWLTKLYTHKTTHLYEKLQSQRSRLSENTIHQQSGTRVNANRRGSLTIATFADDAGARRSVSLDTHNADTKMIHARCLWTENSHYRKEAAFYGTSLHGCTRDGNMSTLHGWAGNPPVIAFDKMTLSYDQVFANYYLIGFVGNLHCSLDQEVQFVWISSGAVTNYGLTIARGRSKPVCNR